MATSLGLFLLQQVISPVLSQSQVFIEILPHIVVVLILEFLSQGVMLPMY